VFAVKQRMGDGVPGAESARGSKKGSSMRKKNRFSVFSSAGLAFFALSLQALAPSPALGQTVPTGYQEYYVTGYDEQVWRMFNAVATGEGQPAWSNRALSIVGVAASANGQRITYDQWEGGFETNILAPVQASTLVLGDGNAANGTASSFTTDSRVLAPATCPSGDCIFRGTVLTFASDKATGATINQYIPMPRVATDVRFDGGDRMYSSGGPLAVVHYQHPDTTLLAGSCENLSRQTVGDAFSYSVPVGTNTYTRYGGNTTAGSPFKYVYLDLVAFEDGTNVFVDNKGGGTASFTLNKGQHWSSEGRIDNAASATAVTILEGTKVSTNKPLTGLIFTAGSGTWQSRFYALLPDILHGQDFVTTAPGDDPAVATDRPMNLYVYNPSTTATISVSCTDSVGAGTMSVAPNSVRAYTETVGAGGMGRSVPANSTVRMTSTSTFWGISAYEYDGQITEWGHSWLATRYLTDNYAVSWAPGTSDPAGSFAARPAACNPPTAACNSLNRSPIWIAATQDNTRVQIDFNLDGVADVVDTNSDDVPNPAPLPNNTYLINAGQTLRVYDQTDYDNTGTQIFANKPVACSFGQDSEQGETSDPTLDLGNTIYPLDQRWLDPVLTVSKTASPESVPTAGGFVDYTITVNSFSFGGMTNVGVEDFIPAGTSYVSGSTLITYPGGGTSTVNPTQVPPTAPETRTKLVWTLSPSTLGANQALTVRFRLSFPGAMAAGTYRNEARSSATLGSSVFNPVGSCDVVKTDVTIVKTVAQPTANAGSVLDYTIVVTNTGTTSETGVKVTDPIPANTTFLSATGGGTFNSSQNAVIWTVGTMTAGSSVTLSFKVTIVPGASVGEVITNRANYESTQTTFLRASPASTTVTGPNITFAKTGTISATPGSRLTYRLTVTNSGTGPGTNIVVTDLFPTGTTYVASSMILSMNGGAWSALTDATTGDDAGYAFANRVELRLASLAAGAKAEFEFAVTASDALVPPTFVNNQASITGTNVPYEDSNLLQTAIVAPAALTPPPVVNSPIIAGETSVSGTSTSPAGTTINVYVDGVFVGTTTVLAGGTWTLSGLPPLVAGQHVSATAKEPAKTVSTFSAEVIVSPVGQVTPPPVVNQAYAGDTSISGTSTSPDGTLIDVFVNGVYLGQTIVVSGGWTLNGVEPLIVGDLLTAKATEPGKGTSILSNQVTVAALPPILKRSSANGSMVAPGDTLTYTIDIKNGTAGNWTNIVLADPLPSGLAYVAASTQITAPASSSGTYRDEFTAVSYAGSNGTIAWATTPWVEVGETNGTGTDAVRVIADLGDNSVRIRETASRGLRRPADLTGWASATLTFDWRRNNFDADDQIWLEVSTDGGTTWPAGNRLATFSGTGTDAGYIVPPAANTTFDLTSYVAAGANFQLRFSSNTTFGGGGTRDFFFDNVQIAVSKRLPQTTAGCAPPTLVGAAGCNGFTLFPGETIKVTFQATVTGCLSGNIVNTATLTVTGTAPVPNSSAATDPVDPNSDQDNDGIPDSLDGCSDSDGDGIANYLDLDSDNDGLLDSVEMRIDTDGDEVYDYLDLDSDNDGINDIVESGLNFTELAALDTNGDGQFDLSNSFGSNGLADTIETVAGSGLPDYDNNGTADAVVNTDGTGPADFRDLDSDNDGINDVIEGGELDVDGNGIIDGTPNGTTGQIPGADNAVPNTDGTGLPDYRDLDSDGDGTNDIVEGGLGSLDGNNDGVIDDTTDGDGDGIVGQADGLPGAFGDANVTDTDGDGIPDTIDIDDDNDGILDTVEGNGTVDTDGDGVPDSLDLDSDNDGINDLVESGLTFTEIALLDTNGDGRIDSTMPVGTNGLADMIEAGAADSGNPDYDNNGSGPDSVVDTDGDGRPDFRDLDSDNDGLNDVVEGGGTDADGNGILDGTPNAATGQIPGADNAVPDTDSDGTPDFRDLDSDGDGIKDITESGQGYLDGNGDGKIDNTTDTDGDGIPNVADGAPSTFGDAKDSDSDGIPDATDIDDDNDGILDTVEGPPGTDTDGDGVPDSLDLDSDNDGINDLVESGIPLGSVSTLDTNGDGRIDTPVGTNGLANSLETVADNGIVNYTLADTDGDGRPDFRDLDSDNDGINDVIEGGETDSDGDGIIDGAPNGAGQIPGSDNVVPDTDSDGTPDFRDLDSDGDGIKDITESGQGYLDGNGDGKIDNTTDTDGDGIPNVADGAPSTFGDAKDSDNDGIPDATDIDDDNDGILDTVEGNGTVDTDGDGIPDSLDRDSDNDGINDLVESGILLGSIAALDTNGDGRIDTPVGTNGLANSLETVADNGIVNYTLADTDGDGRPDFRDLDSDNDGINDVIEGGEFDADGNGIIDGTADGAGQITGSDNVVPDADSDGTPDFRDLDSDGNGLTDITESGQGYLDGNGDGKIDNTTDTDVDGIPDVADGAVGFFGDAKDSDNDGIPDVTDIDDDNDGILDTVEGPPGTDTDEDGVPDSLDLDSDNDGINDLVESGLNSTELVLLDTNGDGRIDASIPVGTNGLANMIEAGAADSGNPDYDNNNSGPDPVVDTDGDGRPDFRDLDSDNDSIPDVLEGGGTDADFDGILDGTPNPATGQIPGADNPVPNSDGTGLPDYRDLDSNDDGVKDIEESGQSSLDVDGDGDIDDMTDPDVDGIPDVSDGAPGTFGNSSAAYPNLLRNDDATVLNPVLESIFIKSYPLPPATTSLDGVGVDLIPTEGEGAARPAPGSSDDDDFYIRTVTTTVLDPDVTVLGDDSRKLVFYELTCDACVITAEKRNGRVAITW
jgi:uncharacterized repeat protein (TIGR01451 family)